MSITPGLAESPEPRARDQDVGAAQIRDTAPRFAGLVWVFVLAAVLGLVVTASVVLGLLDILYDGDGGALLAAAVW